MFEKLAARASEHLIRHAKTEAVGWYWPTASSVRGGFTGFAHGAAGIAAALQRVADLTGQARFAQAAEAAIGWEDAQRDPHTLDWPDYRMLVSGHASKGGPVVAWCHGAAGIGLARALSSQSDTAAIRHARSGIGYGLLRSIAPHTTPDVLALELADSAARE